MPLTASEQYDANKKTDQCRRDKILRERTERAGERYWHLGQRDPVARFTLWLVISTILLFIATVATFHVLDRTDHTLKEALIAANRAWISPRGVSAINGSIEGPDDIIFRVHYVNVGKGPALKTNVRFHYSVVANDAPGDNDAEIDGGPNDTCDGLLPDENGFSPFPDPTPGASYYKSGKFPWNKITPAVKEKDALLVVNGCMVYESLHEIDQTKFCFFLHRIRRFSTFESSWVCKNGINAK